MAATIAPAATTAFHHPTRHSIQDDSMEVLWLALRDPLNCLLAVLLTLNLSLPVGHWLSADSTAAATPAVDPVAGEPVAARNPAAEVAPAERSESTPQP
ncbi:MAG: hypothetical protein R3E86_21975, partial [Pseudomonadales bacterium]